MSPVSVRKTSNLKQKTKEKMNTSANKSKNEFPNQSKSIKNAIFPQRRIIFESLMSENYKSAIFAAEKLVESTSKISKSDPGNSKTKLDYLSSLLILCKLYIEKKIGNARPHLKILANEIKQLDYSNKKDMYSSTIWKLSITTSEYLEKVGDFKASENLRLHLLSCLESYYGQEDIRISDEYFAIADFYSRNGYLDKAKLFLKLSMEKRSKFCGEHSEPVADCLYNLAIISLWKEKDQLAIENIHQALKIRKELIGENSLEVAACHEVLGIIYQSREEYRNSLEKYEECYKIRIQLLDESHELVEKTKKLIQSLSENISKSFYGKKEKPIEKEEKKVLRESIPQKMKADVESQSSLEFSDSGKDSEREEQTKNNNRIEFSEEIILRTKSHPKQTLNIEFSKELICSLSIEHLKELASIKEQVKKRDFKKESELVNFLENQKIMGVLEIYQRNEIMKNVKRAWEISIFK